VLKAESVNVYCLQSPPSAYMYTAYTLRLQYICIPLTLPAFNTYVFRLNFPPSTHMHTAVYMCVEGGECKRYTCVLKAGRLPAFNTHVYRLHSPPSTHMYTAYTPRLQHTCIPITLPAFNTHAVYMCVEGGECKRYTCLLKTGSVNGIHVC
jgi:hypothetical protein